jgi:hypothetical protein
MVNTGKRSLVKISRRSAAASVTSEHHMRSLIYFGTAFVPRGRGSE